MNITLSSNDTELPATLVDGETTQDFMSLLPLTLTLSDYEDFDYSPGLVKLGRIHSGIEVLAGSRGEVTVTVSRSTP